MFVQMWPNISTLACLVVCSDAYLQTLASVLCCYVLFKEERISPDNLSKQAIILLSFLCFIFIYLLTYFCSFSKPCTVWSRSVFAVVFSPGKIGDCLECFQLMKDLSHCRMVDFRLSINGQMTLPRLMGNNSCFSKVLADIFPALVLW